MAKSKAERIMALWAEGKSTREIARAVLGLAADAKARTPDYESKMAYVRVVIRQRGGGARSAVDDKYAHSEKGKAMRARNYRRRWDTDPEYKAKLIAAAREWQKNNPERWREIVRRSRAKAKEALA